MEITVNLTLPDDLPENVDKKAVMEQVKTNPDYIQQYAENFNRVLRERLKTRPKDTVTHIITIKED